MTSLSCKQRAHCSSIADSAALRSVRSGRQYVDAMDPARREPAAEPAPLPALALSPAPRPIGSPSADSSEENSEAPFSASEVLLLGASSAGMAPTLDGTGPVSLSAPCRSQGKLLFVESPAKKSVCPKFASNTCSTSRAHRRCPRHAEIYSMERSRNGLVTRLSSRAHPRGCQHKIVLQELASGVAVGTALQGTHCCCNLADLLRLCARPILPFYPTTPKCSKALRVSRQTRTQRPCSRAALSPTN